MRLKPTNRKFNNDKSRQRSSLFIRFGRLSIYACALLFVPIGCNAAFSSTDMDELDPTSLLAIDSEQQEQDLPDIPIPSHAEMSIQPGKPVTRHGEGGTETKEVIDTPTISSAIEGIKTPGRSRTNQLNSNLFQTTGFTAVNFAAEVGDKLPQTSPVPSNASGRQLEYQLSESRISPPAQSPDDSNSKSNELRHTELRRASLRAIIEQVRSVKFETSRGESVEPQQPAQQPVDTSPAVEPQPPAAVLPAETEQQPLVSSTATQPAGKSNSDHTLQIVEGQLKDPNQITNPFELAEILFRSGRMVPAGLCYKQALSIMPTDDPNLDTDRAWILFQIGNCLKDEDPNTARVSYAELIRTHPESPWTEIAKVRYGLIEWNQQEKPVELIQQFNRQKTPTNGVL